MPKKTKGTKGGAKGPQGNGQTKANGKAEQPVLTGSYARFKGNFQPGTEIRAKSPKLKAFKTYGKLRDHLAKDVAEGKSLKAIAAELAVTPARINELVHVLRIEREKGKEEAKS